MDEISQEPRRDYRLPAGPRRWLILAGVAGLVAAVTVVTVVTVVAVKQGDPGAGAGTPVLTPMRIEVMPAAAAGTVLLTCDSAVWSHPDPDWQAGSLRVGTLWLLGGRQQGYARLGQAQQAASGHGAATRYVQLLVHVAPGSTVVMRAAPGTRPYFEFLNSPATTGDYQGLDGGSGFTFVPCSAPDLGHGGLIALYDVGFSIVPGHTASVEVRTSPSARSVWLTFTAPAGRG